jgi:hypothetical protein
MECVSDLLVEKVDAILCDRSHQKSKVLPEGVESGSDRARGPVII